MTFCLLLLAIVTSAFAQRRSFEEMDAAANSVFNAVNSKVWKSESTQSNPRLEKDNGLTAQVNNLSNDVSTDESPFVVYTFIDKRPGYVIVSSDRRLPAVIAFSDNQTMKEGNIPPAMKQLLSIYSKKMESNDELGEEEDPPVDVPTEEVQDVEPLLGDIYFSQHTPYNNKCPVYNDNRLVTGCLATAMAQIMAYYKYPEQMFGDTINYVTKTLKIPVYWDCANTKFDWTNMLSTYSSDSISDYADDETVGSREYMTFTDIQPSATYRQYLEISRFTNISSETLNGQVQLLLADVNGNFIRPVGRSWELSNLGPRYYWNTNYIRHSIPSTISDGTYRLYLGVKKNGSKEWSKVKRATNGDNVYTSPREDYYITVTKNGIYYYLAADTFTCGYTKAQGEAVATLSAACGASAHMNYTEDGSSANNHNFMSGLMDYMGYDKDMYELKSNYFSTDGFLEKAIAKELNNERPVYVCGSIEDGGSHAFVIDGCKNLSGNPYFHVNWGWNGNYNGYFLLNMMYLQDNNYGYAYGLTLNVKPNDDIDDGYAMCAESVSAQQMDDGKIKLTLDKFCSCQNKTFAGDVLVYARNNENVDTLIRSYHWNEWKGFAGYQTFDLKSGIGSLASGDYTFIVKAKENGSSVEREIITPAFPTIHIDNLVSGLSNVLEDKSSKDAAIYDLSGKRLPSIVKKQVIIIDGKQVIMF